MLIGGKGFILICGDNDQSDLSLLSCSQMGQQRELLRGVGTHKRLQVLVLNMIKPDWLRAPAGERSLVRGLGGYK